MTGWSPSPGRRRYWSTSNHLTRVDRQTCDAPYRTTLSDSWWRVFYLEGNLFCSSERVGRLEAGDNQWESEGGTVSG